MFDTYVGTTDGVVRLGEGAMDLSGETVSALCVADGAVLAGTYGSGLFRRGDDGWERVDIAASVFRFLSPGLGGLLAGTEPARVFRSGDGGAAWEELDGITAIEGHEDWFLPYSPRAGAARNAFVVGDRVLVAAEVAGLLRSDDGGETWVCEPVVGDEDVHHITGDGDLLYASLGSASLRVRGGQHGGIARSRDGGRMWDKLETDYTRATLLVDDVVLAGPALRVGRGGRIVVSSDGGDTWEPAGNGIEVPMPDMVELFVRDPDGDVWAICSGGRLLRARPGEWSWSSVLPADVTARSIAFASRAA